MLNWAKSHSSAILIIISATLITWLMLVRGWLPVYGDNQLEKNISYTFPLWVIIVLLLWYMLEDKSIKVKRYRTMQMEEAKEKNE